MIVSEGLLFRVTFPLSDHRVLQAPDLFNPPVVRSTLASKVKRHEKARVTNFPLEFIVHLLRAEPWSSTNGVSNLV